MKTTVTVSKYNTVDEPSIKERLLQAVEAELAEAGVDPEQVRLCSIHYPSAGEVEIEVRPR